MVGLSFEAFQDESLKTKTSTVKDLWLRQLTVCPRMSVEKARVVAESFPTFRLLAEFYQNHRNGLTSPEQLLYEAIPTVPRSLSQQLSAFFVKT